MKTKKALVTGATGFIGSNLVEELLKQGLEVIGTGNESENKLPKEVKILYPSFVGIDWNQIKDIDIVFHQASLNDTTCTDSVEMERANGLSSARLFNHCLEQGCRKFVYASSTAVYGQTTTPSKEYQELKPANDYARSKVILENIAKICAERYKDAVFVGLRYCNCFGKGEKHKKDRASMIYKLAQSMKFRPPKLFEFGEQRRDYIYIDDVVKLNILASGLRRSDILNCGSGKSTTFNDLIKILNKQLNKNWKPTYIPNPYQDMYQNFTECDMTHTNKVTGWLPKYNIEEGIEAYKKSGFL